MEDVRLVKTYLSYLKNNSVHDLYKLFTENTCLIDVFDNKHVGRTNVINYLLENSIEPEKSSDPIIISHGVIRVDLQVRKFFILWDVAVVFTLEKRLIKSIVIKKI